MTDVIRIGGRSASLVEAEDWVWAYFNPDNRNLEKPYAHPAYDEYDSSSGPSELNDGDLLAPTLLHATPKVRAFYSLQRVRPRVVAALARIPLSLTLSDAIASKTLAPLLGDLVAVLDDPEPPVGVRLTTLLKILHRKRPEFVPLYDKFVGICYRGAGDEFPVRPDPTRSWREYAVAVAHAMDDDLSSQPDAFARLQKLAPQASTLRLLDVVAWKTGQQAGPADTTTVPE